MSKKFGKTKIWYANTKIDPEDTKADITKRLKIHGITSDHIQWTGDILKFIMAYEVNGVQKALCFEIRPPHIVANKRTWNTEKARYEKIDVPLTAQAMRLMFWYIDSKLKAIEWGLVDIKEELMQNIIIPGTDTRIGDVIMKRIEEDTLAKLPAPDTEKPEDRRVIEAEYSTSPVPKQEEK
jgi:hypothetical protein